MKRLMTKYKFEVQNKITIQVSGINVSAARADLLDNLLSYACDMINDCAVSDGEEV